MMTSPTRAQIEELLATIPVAKTKGARTAEKKAARNARRRDKIQAFLEANYDDPRVVQLVMNDLDSYMNYEVEVEDPPDA